MKGKFSSSNAYYSSINAPNEGEIILGGCATRAPLDLGAMNVRLKAESAFEVV